MHISWRGTFHKNNPWYAAFVFCLWRQVAYYFEVLHAEEGGYFDSNTLCRKLDDVYANDTPSTYKTCIQHEEDVYA